MVSGLPVKLKNGSHADADAIVGCVGIKSHVGPRLLGEDDPAAHANFAGKYAYRGLVPMDEAIGATGKGLAINSQMWFSHHGHLLTFPIERGDVPNVLAFRTKEDGEWQDDRWVISTDKSPCSITTGWGNQVRNMLDLIEEPDIWALFDQAPARTYCRGRIALMDNAAHASTPHKGVGAGMALEGAYVLSNILGICQQNCRYRKRCCSV